MSKTIFVEFRGRGFWAFDVVSGVFLKHLIDTASQRLAQQNEPWLADAIAQWRVNAVISDYGLFLDDAWSAEQVQLVTELSAAACLLLSQRMEIPAEEISSWVLLDDMRIFPRGLSGIRTESAVRLGRAIVELLNG